VCACVFLFTVLSVYVLSCAASGVIKNDDDDCPRDSPCSVRFFSESGTDWWVGGTVVFRSPGYDVQQQDISIQHKPTDILRELFDI